MTSPDTADRSLAHWSADARAEMEAFYALAALDYRYLAHTTDWPALLRGLAGDDAALRVLDVACGSGRFPAALQRETGLPDLGVAVTVDLLDPSAFSVAEAKAALGTPFEAGAELVTPLEDADLDAGAYDLVWATHALYAVPPAALAEGLRRALAALRPGGVAYVAHASAASHYLRVYEAYRAGLAPDATAYVSSEDVVAALVGLGAVPEVRRIRYAGRAAPGERAVVEGYLQRCLFDDALTLDAMLADPHLGPYLATCTDADGWVFRQDVDLVTVGLAPVELAALHRDWRA